MSSPFQKSFMAKSPVAMALKGNQDKLPDALQQEILNSPAKQTIKLSDEDLKDPKSASSAPAPQLDNVEGQGGFDYESPDFDNVEGQGGIDYEAADYKKKTKSVINMNSPLNSYENPQGEVYLSDQPAFQDMQGRIQAAADQVTASWTDEKQEAKLDRRILNRGDREKEIRNDRKKLISFGPNGKLLKGDDRKNFADKVTFDENEFLEDGTTPNPEFGEITGGSKKAIKFHNKTEELKDRKTDVTNKITADLKAYEADKLAFGNDPEGIKKLNAKWPRPPRS